MRRSAAGIDLLIERAFPANGQVTPCNSQQKRGGNKNSILTENYYFSSSLLLSLLKDAAI